MSIRPKRVLVLCKENSSRSQMAEAYLRFFVNDSSEFFSAGLDPKELNPHTIDVMIEDNIDISNYRSKAYTAFVGQHFDYLITVCKDTHANIPSEIQFDSYLHFSIPDPASFEGTEEQKKDYFREVREIVKQEILLFIGQELFSKEESITFRT